MFSRKRADAVNSTAYVPPPPRVVEATGNWRGNDGQWSTFWINVGDVQNDGGGQNFEIVPSTHFGVAVLPYQSNWCTGDCASDRGIGNFKGQPAEGVQTTADGGWNEVGIANISTPEWWQNKSSTPQADYGLDYVGIGQAGPLSFVAPNMYVAATTSKDFYLGYFGLGPGATNVGGGKGDVESIIAAFAAVQGNTSAIPSASYGYTAGAKYRNNQNGVYGSLVLGGYDEARINANINRVSIHMPSDKNTSLVVGVQRITYRPNSNVDQDAFALIPGNAEGFMATIDSTYPYLYLPDVVCDQFAKQLNLNYDNKTNFYTMNVTGASQNDQLNGTIEFRVGKDAAGTGSDQTTISLPYSAFELEYFDAESPDEKTKYFPIRRSKNGRFVLGRTFLQEAYIIADYRRANFTVAPVVTVDSPPPPKLVAIYDPSYTPPAPTLIPMGGDGKGLSGGAIAGIVIGILAVALGAAFGIFFWWKRRRERKSAPPTYKEVTEIDTSAAGNEVKHRRISELDSRMPGAPKTPTALGGFYGGERDDKDASPLPPLSELDSPPSELYSPPTVAATPHSEGSGGPDYFTVGGKLGRRGATRESSTNNTPGTPPYFTPVHELPGDDGGFTARGQHREPGPSGEKASPKLAGAALLKRDPSTTQSRSNIDEVMGRRSPPPPQDEVVGEKKTDAVEKKAEAVEKKTDEGADTDAVPEGERRPSHTRGASDSTVVSQPTPEELASWALDQDKDQDGQPRRPLSE